MKNFSIILAGDDKYGIGKNKDLAWKISEDMKFFKKITSEIKDKNKKNAVVMGRTTWESIPEKFRPLPNRLNCVLTSKKNNSNNEVSFFSSFEDCILELSKKEEIENIFIMGGAQIYNYVAKSPFLKNIYFTKVFGDFGCDVFAEKIGKLIENGEFKKEKLSEQLEEKGVKFQFLKYVKNI